MDNTCVDDALEHPPSMARELDLPDFINEERLGVLQHEKKVKAFQVEFRFLKMLSCRLPQWDSPLWGGYSNMHFSLSFNSIITAIEDMRENEGKYLYGEWIAGTRHENFTEWNTMAAKVNHIIQECKAQTKKYGEHLIPISLRADFFTLNETVQYLDVIYRYMNGLVDFDEFAPVKSNIKKLEEILFLLRYLIAFTPRSGQENYEEALHLEFYVHHWATKAECMTVMSLRNKETREKIIHFLHKANPFTPELIRLCFGHIQVQKLRRSDSLIFWEFVSRFVDFFMENVVSTLKDDVRLLREGLILLITFLADPPTNTMDHSDLSYFQQKLHAVFDQASRTIGETAVVDLQESVDEVRGKMDNTCVEDALEHLSSMARELDLPDSINEERLGVLHLDLLHKKKVKAFLVEFGFLKMLSCRFPQWDFDENLHLSLICVVTTIEDMYENERKDLYGEWIAGTGHKNFTQWNSMAEVNHKILECMAKIKNYGKHLIPRADFFTRNETVQYLDVIHRKMNDLVEGRVDEFAPVKSHIKTLEEILFLLRHLIAFTPRSGQENYEKALHLEFYVHHWANKAVSMKLLSWLNEEQDEEPKEKLRGLHLDFLHKANPFTPEFIRLCFGLIQVQKLRRSDTLIFGEFVSRFVDFFLENVVFTLKDDVPVLREGLILLITFLADPPTNTRDHSDLSFFQQKIHAVFDQASHTIGKTTVVHLQESVDEVRGEIERLYVQIAHPSWSNFPRTNGLGHFENLLVYLENLKETMNKNNKVVPFIKHWVFTIKEELMPLKLLLQDIWKMQNDHEEVKGMWDQIISLSYQADLAIKSSFFIDHSIWYNLTSLSLIVEKIKYIQNKVMTIKDNHIYKTEAVPPLMSSVDVFKAPTSTSIVEVVVGFKQETEELIDRLATGTKKVDIVSIVGMGGIGKTTLAKKLFSEPSIRYHFHKHAFCSVSQEYRKRSVLLDILSDLCKIDDKVHQMSDDELAHILCKCLSGYKYLIVMDDIWDIDAWYDVRTSFPDNNNGSRVIFTTRISNISLIAKPDSNPHWLPFLSIDESWELLRIKIFHKDPCPPHLCKVGKLIAEKCRGLPLAIVVIAGLLTRTERSLSHWNEVADALTTFASSEGCKDIIRLSYKRLPEPLKSCFLYLGAFREDEKIKAKMLTKLWVAEGFVLKSGSNLCLRKVAKQYLNQLGDTNLVTVTKRSCNGGIKHFHVHDLIRDFCRTEAQEQHYLCFVNSQNSKLSMPSVCDQYRVCIEDEWRSFVDSKPRGPTVHSLLHYSKDYCVAKSLESFLCNFKLVQVLDLQMQVEVFGGFPTAVTTLVHLRYLALRLHMLGTEKVPSEISNLWNLETLLILGIKVQFPCDIWKMKRLRHVETDDEAHVALDDDLSGFLSQLPDLETFISLVIPPGKDGEELLRRLPNIRKLSCLFSGYSCFQIPKLDILTNLESLQIRYIGEGFFRYPYTFTFPLTIRKLTLESFELHWNEFTSVIRKLPTLQVLVLRWTTSSYDAKIWDVQDEKFRNIRSLTLEDLDIEEWKASIDSFPYIEKLKLSYCKHLIQVPPCFGEVPTLKHVLVRYCNNGVADSALQIQLDSGNQINLKVVTHNNINLKNTI